MEEGQEIFTSKKKLFNRDYSISYPQISAVGIFGGIIFIFTGVTIALISGIENKYLIAFIEFYQEWDLY